MRQVHLLVLALLASVALLRVRLPALPHDWQTKRGRTAKGFGSSSSSPAASSPMMDPKKQQGSTEVCQPGQRSVLPASATAARGGAATHALHLSRPTAVNRAKCPAPSRPASVVGAAGRSGRSAARAAPGAAGGAMPPRLRVALASSSFPLPLTSACAPLNATSAQMAGRRQRAAVGWPRLHDKSKRSTQRPMRLTDTAISQPPDVPDRALPQPRT